VLPDLLLSVSEQEVCRGEIWPIGRFLVRPDFRNVQAAARYRFILQGRRVVILPNECYLYACGHELLRNAKSSAGPKAVCDREDIETVLNGVWGVCGARGKVVRHHPKQSRSDIAAPRFRIITDTRSIRWFWFRYMPISGPSRDSSGRLQWRSSPTEPELIALRAA